MRRDGGGEMARLPDVRRQWLFALLASLPIVLALLGYGVLSFRGLNSFDMPEDGQEEMQARSDRVLDEPLLRAARKQLDERSSSHRQLLDTPPADIVDPSR